MKKFYFVCFIIFLKKINSEPINKQDKIDEEYLERRFNEWTWLTAHNSHLNWFDNSVIDLASNQNASIDQQLKYGVRAFMFDIDYIKCSNKNNFFLNFDSICKCEGVCLCHGQCTTAFKDGFNIKKFEYALRKLVNFLLKNKNEIITIFIEDYLTDTKQLQNVFDRVKYFNSLVFDPYSIKWDVLKNGWPKIKDMINENKRILIIDDEQKAFHARKSPGIIRSRDYLLQNNYEWFKDMIEWDIANISNIVSIFNSSKINLELSRCFSVHKINLKPDWSKSKQLNLNEKQSDQELINKDKLFLFHHYYGVLGKSLLINQNTVKLMNRKEFILKRLNDECYFGTNFKKPNYIALDFVDQYIYNDFILPFNLNI